MSYPARIRRGQYIHFTNNIWFSNLPSDYNQLNLFQVHHRISPNAWVRHLDAQRTSPSASSWLLHQPSFEGYRPLLEDASKYITFRYIRRHPSWSAVAQLVECRTRNRESPGSNPRCYHFEVWAFSFTSRRLSRLSCINEYLAIDSGGNVSE